MYKKNILVTGGLGFIGSNFIHYLMSKNKDYNIINIDSVTYAADFNNLADIDKESRYQFIEGDIVNRKLLEQLFEKYNFCGVFHFAAESHVDNSISSPNLFIETNVLGTFNLLDVAYKNWMDSPHKKKEEHINSRFHHVSTDEVYGSLGPEGFFTEETSYSPNSPYSASKASSDMIARSYFETFGLNITISNCSNNYGPKQHKEMLIPKIINNAINLEQIPIYGKGDNIRDWLFVEDHCSAIETIFEKGISGETYLIGGDNEITNLNIAEQICSMLDKMKPKSSSYSNLIEFVSDRPGHDFRYAIDCTKIKNELNWKVSGNFQENLIKTIEWYLALEG